MFSSLSAGQLWALGTFLNRAYWRNLDLAGDQSSLQSGLSHIDVAVDLGSVIKDVEGSHSATS